MLGKARKTEIKGKKEMEKTWGPCLKVKVAPISLSLCLSLSLFLSLGTVKIMDCHAKWPDTRGQRGCLGGGVGEEGVIVGDGGEEGVIEAGGRGEVHLG